MDVRKQDGAHVIPPPPLWSSFPASKTSRALRTDANPQDVPASAVAFRLSGWCKKTNTPTNKKHHRCFPAESMPPCVILPDAKSRFLEPPHFPAVCTRERIFSSSSSSSCATSFRRWSGACRPLRSSALPPPPPPPLPPLHHRLHCRRHLSLSACQSDTLTSVVAPNTTLNALPRLSLPPARAPPFSSACLLSSSLQK